MVASMVGAKSLLLPIERLLEVGDRDHDREHPDDPLKSRRVSMTSALE